MKKILNRPADFVDEMLQGIVYAHPNDLRFAGDQRALVRADAPVKGKVGIATGGGSGHLPVFLGYVGKGLLDGCAVGNVFSSPTANQMLAVTKAISGGAGVLYLYGNYTGDVMNFDMAAEMADMEDIKVETVLVADDVASAPPQRKDTRRGVAGLFFAYKIAGACAAEMADLATVKRAAEKALANTRSMGVALSPCTVPEAGRPTFTIGDDEMEIGMGIHGEPGVRRGKLETADADRHHADRGGPEGPAFRVGRQGGGAGEWPRCDAQGRAVHRLSQGVGVVARCGHQRPPSLHRRVRHVDGDGGLLVDADAAGRRTDAAARCSR